MLCSCKAPRSHLAQSLVFTFRSSFVITRFTRYGDRFPKTILGRSIAILWFLTGIVLSSLLVSSITSSMSVRILDRHLNIARGKKVSICIPFFSENPLSFQTQNLLLKPIPRAFVHQQSDERLLIIFTD